MNILLFVGSPRVRSNTRSIVAGLRVRLTAAGATVTVLDPKRGEETMADFVSQSIDALQAADAQLVVGNQYLHESPLRIFSKSGGRGPQLTPVF